MASKLRKDRKAAVVDDTEAPAGEYLEDQLDSALGDAGPSNDLWDADSDDDDMDVEGDDKSVDDEPAGDLADGDDEPFDEPEREDAPAVRDVLSAVALRTLSAKMRARPLSAQANAWVMSTLGRLYDEYVDGVQDGEPIAKDLAILLEAAGHRGLVSQLSDPAREGIRHLIADSGIVAVQTGDAPAIMVNQPPAASGVASPSSPLVPVSDERVIELAIGDVVPDHNQPRDEGADAEIGDELHEDTVLPPIEVRPHPYAGEFALERDGKATTTHPPYMIVDGERRWRGSIKAGRTTIRAIVNTRPLDTGDLLLRQAALNQGKRLKPLEEARAWKRIVDAKQWTVQQLADYLKKPRSTVADRVAMLEAPKPFLRLFEQGILSPAAAPLIRPLGELDDATATEILNAASEGVWYDNMQDGVAIPLTDVERGLLNGLREVGAELTDATTKKEYAGQRVTIGKHVFALDLEAYDAIFAAHREKTKQRASSGTPIAAPAKADPAVDRYKAQRAKEERARKAKSELRLAQFRAVASKLPKTLTRNWALMLARGLVGELTQDTGRLAVRALGLRESKSATGGLNFDRDLIKHAESLKSPIELLQFMTHCLMAHDLHVNPNYDSGTKRLGEAAKLAGVNFVKVKSAPDPSKAPAGVKPAPAKKKVTSGGGGGSEKRSSSRSTMNSAPGFFMRPQQPSPALAAIVGAEPLPRTEVTMRLWTYIKKHGLQDATERRNINADEKLKPVFGKNRVSMFEMTKLINKHLTPTKG
jgi:upstream activation factor subunit UAF30